MTVSKDQEKRIAESFELLRLPRTAFPKYSSPQQFGKTIEKFSILSNVPTLYAANTIVVTKFGG